MTRQYKILIIHRNKTAKIDKFYKYKWKNFQLPVVQVTIQKQTREQNQHQKPQNDSKNDDTHNETKNVT